MARDPKSHDDDWLAVGQNAVALKSLARRLNVPVVCACQLNSEAENKRPALAHLSRARGIISQEADVIVFLYPEPKEWDDKSIEHPHVTAIIEKQRGGPCGEIGLIFDRALTRFYCVGAEAEPMRSASLPYKD
jgi:replicative DNA helicase